MTNRNLLRPALTAGALALTLALSACGSSSDEAEATETTAASETTAAAETTAAPETTAAAETTTTAAAAPAAEGQPVDLGEWFITPEGEVAAGTTTFALTNSGEFPHALAIAVGDAYENLPQLENGAVDVETLGADYLGTSENLEPGASGEVTFDLAPGNYVFFCPIAFGPNSHAKAGQVLSVTIS